MRFDAIGFGALNMDRLYEVNRIAGRDEESFVTASSESPGGSAANTIVGLARLGLKTGCIGKCARDREGEIILNDLRAEGVDTGGVVVSPHGRTGVVSAYIDRKGERALYADPGVNDTLESGEISRDYAGDTHFLHLTSFAGGGAFKAQIEVVQTLPDVRLTFDPGSIYAHKGLCALRPLIRRSAVVFPNALEIRVLTGQEWEEGAKVLIKEGAEAVAVTLGSRGCYVTDGSESYLIEPTQSAADVSFSKNGTESLKVTDATLRRSVTESVSPTDTTLRRSVTEPLSPTDATGAGDAFSAGFIYGLCRQKDLYECGRLGNFVASRCISATGARTALPHLQEI